MTNHITIQYIFLEEFFTMIQFYCMNTIVVTILGLANILKVFNMVLIQLAKENN